jgi:hypothetical protein
LGFVFELSEIVIVLRTVVLFVVELRVLLCIIVISVGMEISLVACVFGSESGSGPLDDIAENVSTFGHLSSGWLSSGEGASGEEIV